MIRPDLFLIGYVEYTLDGESVREVAECFLKNRISVYICKNKFTIRLDKVKKIDGLLASRVKFSKSEPRGIGGMLCNNRKRYGVFVGIFLALLVFILSSDLVWDVRVEGNLQYGEDEIIAEIGEHGLRTGARWSDIDKGKLEVAILSASDKISWININRRGSVAYVSLVEKEVHEQDSEPVGYANVVAVCDAVIEEITVVRGFAMVEVGESVKKGDLLISGIIPGELGGGFCYAEGNVRGRVQDSCEISVKETYSKKVIKNAYTDRVSLNIFGFSVNIFKSYRNFTDRCDIIEEDQDLFILGKRLPISVTKRYIQEFTLEEVTRTSEEMTGIARDELGLMLSQRLAGSSLVRLHTEGDFHGSEYLMKTSFICLEEIGTPLPFDVRD